ncbi:hypothetical protein OIU84_000377 [Salix udensis]|uniref:Uncharacterized protein n=1 Tax=Salix udensis TaxID=889485 RepID=A0AAD6L631_9ROSI|nr:hypothetical protein OIU84_000377 [Salix udensis]
MEGSVFTLCESPSGRSGSGQIQRQISITSVLLFILLVASGKADTVEKQRNERSVSSLWWTGQKDISPLL